MRIPLNKLQGAELLPQKINMEKGYMYSVSAVNSHNEAVDDLNECAISINIAKLCAICAYVIDDRLSKKGEWTLYELSEAIASQPEKFLKIVRVSDEVIK